MNNNLRNIFFVAVMAVLALVAAYKARNNHEARHTPVAVGSRYGRSVGQIQRRLEMERLLLATWN